MKKIFLLGLIFISAKVFGQFPTSQSLGAPKTLVYSKGGLGSDSGYVFKVCFADTAQWNLGFIKGVAGIVIRTCDDKLWLRNNTAVKWVLIGTGAGSTDSSFIIIDSTYDDLAYSPTQDSLWIKSQQINYNGVPVIPTSDNYKLSYNIIGGAGSVTDANNGLVDSSGTILLGQNPLYKNTTIGTSASTLTVSTSVGGVNPLAVASTTGNAVTASATDGHLFYGVTTNGDGVQVFTTNGTGGTFASTNGVGVAGQSESNVAGSYTVQPASTNTVVPVLKSSRLSLGTAANGIGQSWQFLNQKITGGATLSNSIISKWTDAVEASASSQMIFTGVTTASPQNWLTLSSGGLMKLDQYGAGTLTTDGSGNVTAVSDVRLKNVKGKYRSGLSAVMNINPIVYKWNDKSGFDTKHNYIGFSAQNIQSVLGPDAVGQDKEGYLSIQDRAIMAAMVNAIKEMQKEIESLQKQILKR